MGKGTIIVAGYGPAISHAVAMKFGKLGYSVALLARTASKLKAAEEEFKKHGIKVSSFPTDLANPEAVTKSVASIKAAMGSIAILFWNPFGTAKGVLDGTPKEYDDAIRVAVSSLIAATHACLSDLEAAKGAILVTGAGAGLESEDMVKFGLAFNMVTLCVAKSAQRKLVHSMHVAFKEKGVYVGEVTVMGGVKGTPYDDGSATITAESVADHFEMLFTKRDSFFVSVS